MCDLPFPCFWRFENKIAPSLSRQVVSRGLKAMVASVLISVNVFFVYYTLLHSYQKGVGWQRSYLYACILQVTILLGF